MSLPRLPAGICRLFSQDRPPCQTSRQGSRPTFSFVTAAMRIRKLTVHSCMALMLLLWTASASQASPSSITVALDKDYPPYIFISPSGEVQGILMDLWNLWQEKTGIAVTLLPMEWQNAQESMLSGKADAIDTLFRDADRDKLYDFSKPYATIEVPVFVSTDIGGIHDTESLRGFTVGVKRGDASIARLTAQGILPLLTFEDYEDVIKAAKDGKIKVFCMDKPPAMYHLYSLGLENEFRLAFVLYTGQFHRAVRKGEEALLQTIEAGFSKITPEEYAAVERKWHGTPLLPVSTIRYTLWGLAILGLAALILLAVNAVLRRTVRHQSSKLHQLETAVGQSEERYRELVESAGSVILRLDLLGRVAFCNTFGLQFFGFSMTEMMGRELGSLIDAADHNAPGSWSDMFANVAVHPDQPLVMDRRHIRRHGQPVWLSWAIRALRDGTEEAREILCIGNDITKRKQAEEALRASEERYTLVARGANDGIWDWNLQTNEVYFSPRYMQILGYAPDEIDSLLEEWTTRIHPDDAEAVIRENKRCADGEVENFAIEYRMRHRDGAYRWILGRGASLRDDNGMVTRMAGTHTDITLRKRDEEALRESQDQLSKIFRFSPVGIAIAERREGRFVDVNETFTRMFGHAKSDMLGRTGLELGLWRHPEDRRDLIEAISRGGSAIGREMELGHKNGSTVVVLISSVPNQSFGEPCILSVLVDITERKAMEQALMRSKEIAEAANRAKSEFLSTMSHEIRTPMNTILGMTDVLAATSLTPAQSQAIKAIELAGGTLLDLLNDILDLSQIEAGGLILEEKACDLLELVTRLVEMMRPDAARKNLSLRLDSADDLPARVLCCPDRIRQVLVNLLGNAVKFTEHGEITLEIKKAEEQGVPRLCFVVRDTGIGIPIDKQALIFERFTQVNATASRQFGGVGLGLAICKKLTEMMGGRIRVESHEGQGSVFTVTLPLHPVAVPEPVPSANQSAVRRITGPPGSVLLVEDSPTNAEVMRLMLEGSNFDLSWAPSGQAALTLLRDVPYDIVLMDVEMPGMDGYQTTEALRELEKELGRQRTPVVALTAHAFEEHRQRCLQAGCDDFQVKPVPKARLLEILETWMSLRPA